MDWKALGKTLAGLGLPILGGAMGGPAGALFGKMAAGALGLSADATPEQVATAVNTNPDNVAKLLELQNTHQEVLVKAAYEAETAAIQAVNATLQADARGDSWLQKNHHAIESLTATLMVVGIYFVLPLLKIPVPTVPEFAFMMLGAILGVTAWKHGVVNQTIAQNQVDAQAK